MTDRPYELRHVARCGSTNSELLAEKRLVRPVLLLADEQTAGRGRRGRRWHSAPGAGLTFSLAVALRRPLRELAGLTLVAGVATVRALRKVGVARAALKWPNDIVVEGGKLGGILVETRSLDGATKAVIGIGINLHGAAELRTRLRREVAALDEFVAVPENGVIADAIALSLLELVAAFEAQGLQAARGEWERLDAHAGQKLRVRLADGRVVTGIASGLDTDGALRLATRDGMRAIRTGRVITSRPA
jgi:BirA family transcriptional regulator, biotin operon repressor / biotin---[acetyl-CoA-carboxylase] ligase